MAASDEHLYVLYSKSPDIEVYDGEILTYQETISIPDLYDPSDIVYNGKHLFVSDREVRTIIRIDPSDKTVKKFKVDGRPMTLSSNPEGNVIVTSSDPPVISEYTADTESVSKLRLSVNGSDSCLYYHAMCASNKSYFACCANNSENSSVYEVSSGSQRFASYSLELLFDTKNCVPLLFRNG